MVIDNSSFSFEIQACGHLKNLYQKLLVVKYTDDFAINMKCVVW